MVKQLLFISLHAPYQSQRSLLTGCSGDAHARFRDFRLLPIHAAGVGVYVS